MLLLTLVYLIWGYLYANDMAMGKYSRVDGRKSSGYCSTVTVVVVLGFCLVGVWMLMSSSVVPVQNPELSSREVINEMKQTVTEKVSKIFEENFGDLQEDNTKRDGNDVPAEQSEDSAVDNQEVKNVSESNGDTSEDKNIASENQEENSVKESSDEKTDSEEESKAEAENEDRKREYGESKSGGGDSNMEAGETEAEGGERNKSAQTELEESSDENKLESGDASETEKENSRDHNRISEQNINENDTENHEKDQASIEIFPASDQSEILNETSVQNGAWSTQAIESENEKKSQQSSTSKDQRHHWKLCNASAGPDYIPCLDNWQAIRKLNSTKHYEHRERHCPEEAPTCIVPLPEGYRRSIKWPKSRDKV